MKTFKKASYSQLNSKQKENHNFHKLASLLASYGFNCIWLNDDVHGADLLALSTAGDVYKIQLKSRLTFDKKYMKKDLYRLYVKLNIRSNTLINDELLLPFKNLFRIHYHLSSCE